MTSILNRTKAMLGIPFDYNNFDESIIADINSVFAIWNQRGIGPKGGFSISDASTTWEEYSTDKNLNEMQTCMYMRVRLMFDPPTSSFVVTSINDQINEMEFRMGVHADV